ncbi:hypothetical protein [Polyangium sp. 6x1]|uniref:hypothetical protein n=1 Tax=Polyangium sp. 6x1 TaxID=3042689 RepID=UPI0024823675|nr:hypothetical protein [Polyangium sp. 6x1]MDI1442935.1 hypothetical protein [Polyangium sp. 6x1]
MLIRKTIVTASVLAGLVLACGPEANNTTGGGGSGGAGGGGAGGGGTAKDPAGPKDPDAALKAAIIFGSCIPDGHVDSWLRDFYAERAGGEELNVRDYTQCLASKSNGCKAVEECLGITADLSGPCQTSCTGSVLETCDDQLAFHVDCSVLGRECSAEQRNCVDKSVPVGPACSYDTYVESCKDGAPLTCDNEAETSGPVCADYGLACKARPFGGFGCAGTGATCQSNTESALGIDYWSGLGCDGAELRACINGGEQAVDCSTLVKGFACNTGPGGTSFCGLEGECDPYEGTHPTCDGDSIVVCNAGRVDKVDCKSLGFTGCNADWGRCSPTIYDQFPAPQPEPGP